VAIQRRKILVDLRESRLSVAAALCSTVVGAAWLRFTSSDRIDAWLVVLLLSLVVIAQACVPLARARANELGALRALGADDGAAARFAAIEGGLLGGLAGLIALAISPSPLAGLIWFVAAGATGIISSLLGARV
jgi:predicted lysophospholipase L1 biosynthesis ABC-type transport system permease subunit